MNRFLIIILLGLLSAKGHAQRPAPLLPIKDSVTVPNSLQWQWFTFEGSTGSNIQPVKQDAYPQTTFFRKNEDWRFYAAVLLVIFFGLAKTMFRKIYDQLVILMFRTTVRARQIKEQLEHTTIPSMAFNLLFVCSASLLVMVVVLHYRPVVTINYFLLWLICAGGVAAVYLVKFCWLKMAGWIFNVREAADTYLFFVFFLNKILGIILIPLIVLLLVTSSQITGYLLIIAYFLIGLLMLYRYYLAYGAAQKAIKASPFHFLLYICAVEITPVLLIYRVLLNSWPTNSN